MAGRKQCRPLQNIGYGVILAMRTMKKVPNITQWMKLLNEGVSASGWIEFDNNRVAFENHINL
jgi:hypothetical protein